MAAPNLDSYALYDPSGNNHVKKEQKTVYLKQDLSKFTLAESAIFDYPSFIDHIQLSGGLSAFGRFHKEELIPPLTKPQDQQEIDEGETINPDRRRLFLVPRGHLKTTLDTVGYALWRIYRNPDIRIGIGTATKELAEQCSSLLRQYLEDEDLQDRVWNHRPHIQGRLIPVLDKVAARRRDQLREEDEFTEAEDKKIKWSTGAFQVMRRKKMKEHTIMIMSPKSNSTGKHVDLLIYDDLVNDDIVESESLLARVIRWTMDMESVLDPQRKVFMGTIRGIDYYEIIGDEIVISGTRYGAVDYYDTLIDENLLKDAVGTGKTVVNEFLGYTTLHRNIYENGRDDRDGYLWQEGFSQYQEAGLRRRLTPRKFASQYLNQIIAEEDIILHYQFLQWMDMTELRIETNYITYNYKDAEGLDKTLNIRPIICVDPAISIKKSADYSVVAIGGYDSDGYFNVLDTVYGRWGAPKTAEQIFLLSAKWKCSVVSIETIAYQAAMLDIMRAQMKQYHLVALKEYKPRGEKQGRIRGWLEPLFSNQKIRLSRHLASKPEVKNEINYFGQATTKDDILDCWAQLAEVAKPTLKKGTSNVVLPFRGKVNRKFGGFR